MRKVLAIIAAALLGSVCASAQFSLKAGYQKSQIISTNVAADGFRSYLYAWFDGFYAGATSSYSLIIPGLSFDYSILYSYATGTETDVLSIFADPHYEATKAGQCITDEHCIRVPGTVNYGIALAKDFKASIFAGAEVDYCLSSKSYSSWPGLDGVNHWNVDHFGADTNYNGYTRFDLGVLGGLGFEFMNMIRLETGVRYGLLDRSAKTDDSLHAFGIYAGLAWLFK
ncbi:MAG: PorT family protein [Bacteroidales bacterium]|nr:PorT family protein [Bacteroidales bacterium]